MSLSDVEVAKAGLLRDISDATRGAIANRVLNTGMPPTTIAVSVTVPRIADPVGYDNLRVDCRITWPDGTTTP